MSKLRKDNFNSVVQDILDNNEFKELDNELHHGISRYGHCIRVAKTTYYTTKAMKLDYKTATRAALLHDFFINTDYEKNDSKVDRLHHHPKLALNNAKKLMKLDDKSENIIESHMFPLGGVMPKYKESWLVTCADKGVALYEMYRFKFSLIVNIWAIFIFNMITMKN